MATLLPMLAMAFALLANYQCQAITEPRKVYIVFVDSSVPSTDDAYLQILGKILEGSAPAESLLYNYGKEYSAFAALLTDSEVKRFQGLDGILKVNPHQYPQIFNSGPAKLPSEIDISPAPIESNLI